MNKHQSGGLSKQVKGGLKEATSKITGNKAGEAEGKLQKAVGKVQTKLGNEQERNRTAR